MTPVVSIHIIQISDKQVPFNLTPPIPHFQCNKLMGKVKGSYVGLIQKTTVQIIPYRLEERIKDTVNRLKGLQLPMQSVPITTDVVSSNLDQAEVYTIM